MLNTYSLGSARGTDRRVLCLLPTVWSAAGTDITCTITRGTGGFEGKRRPFFLFTAPAGGADLCAGITVTGTDLTGHEVFTSSLPKFRQRHR